MYGTVLFQAYIKNKISLFSALIDLDQINICILFFQHIGDQIALASKTGELTSSLKKLLGALLSIPAASIESERAFSIASRFLAKIRNRLGDKALSDFCFAKNKFKNDRK